MSFVYFCDITVMQRWRTCRPNAAHTNIWHGQHQYFVTQVGV